MEWYDMIIKFFSEYGMWLTIIAGSGIILLGILKAFNVFRRVDKSKRKYLYTAISAGLSILAAGLYLHFTSGIVWTAFGVLAGSIYAVNQVMYSLYENLGIRAVWTGFWRMIKNKLFPKRKEFETEPIEQPTAVISAETAQPKAMRAPAAQNSNTTDSKLEHGGVIHKNTSNKK